MTNISLSLIGYKSLTSIESYQHYICDFFQMFLYKYLIIIPKVTTNFSYPMIYLEVILK